MNLMKEPALSWHVRQEPVQTKILDECTPEVIDFLITYSGGRLTKEATDYYKRFPRECIVVTVAKEDRYLIGVACCSIRSGTIKHALIVVHPSYRGCKLGKKILVRKIEELNERGLIYESIVACDNGASHKVMTGCGLLSESTKFYRNRRKGLYKCSSFVQTRNSVEFNIKQISVELGEQEC